MTKKELEEQVTELQEKLAFFNLKAFNEGMHLIEQPFIPEYLGFVETQIEESNGAIAARIYTKDGFNIARPIKADVQEYTILKPGGEKITMLLDNMYFAIIRLSGVGINVSVQGYINGDYYFEPDVNKLPL